MFDIRTVTMATKPPQAWTALFLLLFTQLRHTDGCFRSSPREPVRVSTITPSMDASGPQPSHKLDCMPEEVQHQGCLNGGTCFAIHTSSSRQLACTCTEEFTGTRCHLFYIDPRLYEVRQENLRTANLMAGVSVCIMLAFVIIIAVWVYIRYQRRKHRYTVERSCAPSLDNQPQVHPKATTGSNGQRDSCEVETDQNGRGGENCPTTETALLAGDMKESRL